MAHAHPWEVCPVPEELPAPIIGDPSLPLISIVTPSYNQGGYILDTVKSVLSQDYPNIEYWVIDGESTDSTLSILREYDGDPRFHWISEPDQGQSDAINKGLARCQGELFVWLNSDDMLAPGALQHVAAAWQSLEQPAIIYGRATLIDEKGANLGAFPSQFPNMTLTKILHLADTLPQPATYVPTGCIREIGGVNPSLHFAMDLDLWIRLAESIPLRYIPHTLALFREHPTSKSVALTTKFNGEVMQIMEQAAKRGVMPEKQAGSRANLFAARAYTMPGHMDFRAAWKHIKAAVADDATILPEVASLFLKALVRRLERKGRWSTIRMIHARIRQRGLRI